VGKHEDAKELAEIALAEEQATLTRLKQKQVKVETEKLTWRLKHDARLEAGMAAEADESRIYTLYSSIDQHTVEKAIGTLSKWSRRDPESDITIVLNSPGGSVFDGLALYDFLRDLSGRGHDIHIHAMGMAASMGGVLLQAGDTRTMSPNAFMLIHEVSCIGIGSLTAIEDEVKFLKELQGRCVNILTDRSRLTRQKIHSNWKRKDWWIPSEECIKLGLVDEVQ